MFRGMLGGTLWKYYFVITGLSKNQHLLLPIHTILTQKQFFHQKPLKKIFSFKIFRKCSLHVPNIVTLRDHSTNILRIFRADWAADFL